MESNAELVNQIIADTKSGKLKLPSLPDVAVRVRRAVMDDKRSDREIARLVQMDPALAARLLQVVNSPMYRGSHNIDSCQMAITRLGLEITRNLVTSFALRGMFKAQNPHIRKRMQQVWLHSCRVAAISWVLARYTRGIQPDRAMLAGLLHDVGVLPILQYVEQHKLAIDSQADLDPLINRLAPPLGVFLLKGWRFEADIAEIPRIVTDWQRDSGPAPDYGDIVQVAHAHSEFGTAAGRQAPSLVELKAFNKLSLSNLGPDSSLEVLEHSQQEIKDLISMLNAA